jgi:ATP-binding cassette subfamily B protein
MANPPPRTAAPRSLSGLIPFLRPYRTQIALAGLFLVMAAALYVFVEVVHQLKMLN